MESDAAACELYERCAHESGLTFRFEKDSRGSEWDDVLCASGYAPASYISSRVAYEYEYHMGEFDWFHDVSAIVTNDARPVGVWPLTLGFMTNGGHALSSQGRRVLPPILLDGLPTKTRRRLLAACAATLTALAAELGLERITSAEVTPRGVTLPDWTALAMRSGFICGVRESLYARVEEPEAMIKAYSKGTRWSIRSARDLWACEIVDAESRDRVRTWREFKELHFVASGRKTRSEESWRIQQASLENGTGVLVALRDEDGRLVGGGYFQITVDEAEYCVGAYDRGLFGKPVGHLVQFEALSYFHRKGIGWYRIGRYPHIDDSPTPTDKEYSIAAFKQRFATHSIPEYFLARHWSPSE